MMKNYILLLWALLSCPLFSQTTDVILNTNFPGGVLKNNNDLFVSDWQNGNLYKYDLSVPIEDRTAVYMANGLVRTYGLFLEGNDLYFSDTNTHKVYKIDITEENPEKEVVLENLEGPYSVAIHNNMMYVINNTGGSIIKYDLSNSNATLETIVTGIGGPFDLKVINEELYFTQRSAGKLSKIDLNNPDTVIDVLTGLSSPSGLAVKDNKLYISNPYGFSGGAYLPGKIMMIDVSEENPEPSLIYQYPDGSTWDTYGQHLFIDQNVLYIGESFGDKIVSIDLTNLSVTDIKNNSISLSVYPNPASEFIKISGLKNKSNYEIFNAIGQKVQKGEVLNNSNLGIHNLVKGVYFIKFSNSNKTESIKFIKK